MTNKVDSILEELANKRKAFEENEYDFFFRAPDETKEMFRIYWEEHKKIEDAPRYLVDYIESKKHD